ncbi:carbonic anhydrase [Streptomyces violaceusniger]
MRALIEHARSFRRRADFDHGEYRKLADGQFPEALFITCSDSRVIPALITGARPGEIFELRNAGNIVPPHGMHLVSGEAATIEYALEVLGVSDIVVCGHSHCGAMGALASGTDLSRLPGVGAWLSVARPGLAPALGTASDDPSLRELAQLNVRNQLAALEEYPAARRRLETGRLRLHGWFYQVDSAELWELDTDGDFRAHS